MRVPLSWVEELVGEGLDADKVVEALDDLGLVVESVERPPVPPPEVVVARVEEVLPIEGADLIRIARVDAGERGTFSVVCGAPRLYQGQVVALAMVGAELPGGLRIGRRRIKGVDSEGMLAAPAELGIGSDSANLLELDEAAAALGVPLADVISGELRPVLDLEVPPNRGDCMSVLGVCRELAAKLNLSLEVPSYRVEVDEALPAESETLDEELCDVLSGRVILFEEMGTSPVKVSLRLLLSGMRPINAVVDATNYVMLELGQPTHAYDLSKLGRPFIRARAARPGEEVECLDEKVRRLGMAEGDAAGGRPRQDCVIADSEDKAVGIGGVIGGKSTAVEPSTRQVYLEAAHFSPRAILRTARALGVRTEASARFERGVPEGMWRMASDAVASLIASCCRATRVGRVHVSGTVAAASGPGGDGEQESPSRRARKRMIMTAPERIRAYLGAHLSDDEIAVSLERLGYRVERGDPGNSGQGTLLIVPPSWRSDVEDMPDVAEDVARMVGYSRISPVARRSPFAGRLGERARVRRKVRQVAVACGFFEVTTPVFSSHERQKRVLGEAGALLEIDNPLNSAEGTLRASLLPGVLDAARRALSDGIHPARVMEIGRVFYVREGSPEEEEHICAVAASADEEEAGSACAALLQGLSERTASRLSYVATGHLQGGGVLPAVASVLDSGLVRQATLIAVAGRVVGFLGKGSLEVAAPGGAARATPAYMAVLDLSAISAVGKSPRSPEATKLPSKYPSAQLDLAFVVEQGVAAEEIRRALLEAAPQLVERVWLFDAYSGPPLGPGQRNLAYRVVVSRPDKTMDDEDLASVRRLLTQAVEGAGLGRLRQ